jgi:hypothetical protein
MGWTEPIQRGKMLMQIKKVEAIIIATSLLGLSASINSSNLGLI